jgi:hypothetical protein
LSKEAGGLVLGEFAFGEEEICKSAFLAEISNDVDIIFGLLTVAEL